MGYELATVCWTVGEAVAKGALVPQQDREGVYFTRALWDTIGGRAESAALIMASHHDSRFPKLHAEDDQWVFMWEGLLIEHSYLFQDDPCELTPSVFDLARGIDVRTINRAESGLIV